MSILTLYNYDNTIFDNLVIPTGVIKENVVNNLLLELSELEVLYSNPDMMKFAIGAWSKKELQVWNKLYASSIFEYNPIWNQFRTEEYTDKQTRNVATTDNETRNLTGTDNEFRDLSGTNYETRNLTGIDNETRGLGGSTTHHSETTGNTKNSGSDIQEDSNIAFNETQPTLAKKILTTMGTANTVDGAVDSTNTTSDTGTVDKTLTDTGTVNKSITDNGTVEKETTDKGTVNKTTSDSGTIENSHTAKFEGHTGIVPVQKLIEMERETVQFNVINYIISSFKSRFCILIY
jgi:hypothetical protein